MCASLEVGGGYSQRGSVTMVCTVTIAPAEPVIDSDSCRLRIGPLRHTAQGGCAA